MNAPRWWAAIFLLLSLSCAGPSITLLEDADRDWNPYRAGQILLFENTSGERDSMVVQDVAELTMSHGDGLSFFPDKYEALIVRAKVTNSVSGAYIRHLDHNILVINASSVTNNARIEFNLLAKDVEFRTYGVLSSSLDSLPLDTLTTPYGTFRDVLAIADDHPAYADSTKSVKTLYWSKPEGYLRYDLYNGERWWLIDKY